MQSHRHYLIKASSFFGGGVGGEESEQRETKYLESKKKKGTQFKYQVELPYASVQ